jgi:3-oxoacyl-[acyl-carrier-protein] synthase-1
MIFIEGYSLNCSLGRNAKESVQKLQEKTLQPTKLEDGNRYYYIDEHQTQDYYNSIEKVAQEALLNANLTEEEISKIGLFIGTSSAKLPINEAQLKANNEMLSKLQLSELSTIVMERLKIKGFNTIISTACTSSANALLQAKEMIESGLIEKALVLGVELYNELSIKGFNSFQLLSQDKIRPFDKQRDGVILGEGLSAIVLGKNKSHFEFTSGSILVDTVSITSPTSASLIKVMQQSMNKANLVPQDISVIKAHATGTLQNDKAEAEALSSLFPSHTNITALKPYIGHTMGACGTNELVLLMESLKQDFIPKTLNFSTIEELHPLKPMSINIPAISGYYLLNYLGFGGNNCCLIIKYNGK